jgi:hypothetical protein
MYPMKLDWRLKLRLLTARILIRLGKLRHADYSAAELKEIVDKQLPETFDIDVPRSKGKLTLLQADISMRQNRGAINVELLGSILIGALGNPIYRAHLVIALDAYPIYDKATHTVKLDKLLVSDVQLVNDQYSIIEDSRELLSLFFPKPLQNLLSGSVKSAVGLITAGGSDTAASYMKLYLSGSKQRILDYHRPQIEALVSEFAQSEDMQYQLGTCDFEEHLFCLYGKTVLVEDGQLRFKF